MRDENVSQKFPLFYIHARSKMFALLSYEKFIRMQIFYFSFNFSALSFRIVKLHKLTEILVECMYDFHVEK